VGAASNRAAAELIRTALEAARGERAEVAHALGTDRTTLRRPMKGRGL